mmetsp:Transcript_73469/g.107841  ORF Transcript_73469/g.107841 Transcript_73469/m.107841 type:complete len:126 (-) Transcript_73469:30-407(-)
MEQRLVQVSKSVEEVLQETLNLLVATEDEDTQPSRQAVQSSRSHLDALLLSHRQANGATERLQMELQQAQAAMKRLQAQGWQPGTIASSSNPPLAAGTPGVELVSQHMKDVQAYESEMHACLFSK